MLSREHNILEAQHNMRFPKICVFSDCHKEKNQTVFPLYLEFRSFLWNLQERGLFRKILRNIEMLVILFILWHAWWISGSLSFLARSLGVGYMSLHIPFTHLGEVDTSPSRSSPSWSNDIASTFNYAIDRGKYQTGDLTLTQENGAPIHAERHHLLTRSATFYTKVALKREKWRLSGLENWSNISIERTEFSESG